MQLDPQRHILGLLAGAGEYPRLVLEGARRAGVRVVCVGFRGAAKKAELKPLCEKYHAFRVGSVDGPVNFFIASGVTHVMMAGQVKPASFFTMWPDKTARTLLKELGRQNAHSIFGAACAYLHSKGLEVLPATTFMEANMPPAGHLAGPAPTEEQLAEARRGMALAREIARLDIGQSIIVHGQKTLCVEAFKGTNECLREGGGREYPVTLCKVTKPGHDMRFDVPCIGLGTIKNCIANNVRHIVIEAGRTIIFQREALFRICEQRGITLHAMDTPAEGVVVPELPPIADDVEHARALANALEMLGVGHSAAVCAGVVIAVEDEEGPLKCVRRAGEYMRRVWLMRLLGCVLRLLQGISWHLPSRVVMAGTPLMKIDDQLRRAAKKTKVNLIDHEG